MGTTFISKRRVESGSYLAGIDGLRGIAVLSVMVFHLVPVLLPGGFVGVDVFFVISGYVVTNSMLRQRDIPFGKFLLGFYARRFRRIVPPLAVCICIMVPVCFAVMPNSWLSTAIQSTALSAYFGVSNFALLLSDDGYFAPRPALNPFTHTWSLGVEEQFYLLFPMLVYFMTNETKKRSRRTFYFVFIGLTIASIIYSAETSSANPAYAFYLLPSRFWELAFGAIGAFTDNKRRREIVSIIGSKFSIYCGLSLIALSVLLASEKSFPMPWAIPACIGSLLVVITVSISGSDNVPVPVVTQPALVTTGLLSYSLYLWHWPIYTVMRWTIGLNTPILYASAITCTVLAAILSYTLVEYPTQNWIRSRKLSDMATIGVWLSVAVTGFIVSKAIYDRPWHFKATIVERNNYDWYPFMPPAHPYVKARCETEQIVKDAEWDTIEPINCSGGQYLGQTLFVAGDSHAGAYTRLFKNFSSVTGYRIVRFSASGCPIANFYSSPGRFQPHCAPYQAAFVRELKTLAKPGDLVFLASLRSTRLSNQDGPVSHTDIEQATSSMQAVKDRFAAHIEATSLLKVLVSLGLKVIIDLPAPVFKSSPFRCVDNFNSMNPVCKDGFSVDRSYLVRLQGPIDSSIKAAGNEIKHVYIWDPFPVLCPTKTCTAMLGKRPLFFDGDHLSGFGNDVLTPSFEEMIGRVRSAP